MAVAAGRGMLVGAFECSSGFGIKMPKPRLDPAVADTPVVLSA
jgi:hypothetical protein